MKVAYRGNFEPRHSTETHIALSLESMGLAVDRCQEQKVSWSEQIKRAQGCDLFLWTCTEGLANKDRRNEIDGIKTLNGLLPTASIHLDVFFGLKREKTVGEYAWFKVQHCFTADGDNQERFAALGINHHPLMPGVLREECFLGEPRDEYRSDIAFVGAHTKGYHREYAGRMNLVNWLQETYGNRCAFWPKPGQHAVRNEDLNDLYASVKVVVGDSCFADTAVNYTSDRVFETVGRGGFLLYPQIPCVSQELFGGVHLAYFTPGNLDDLGNVLHYWLAPGRAEQRLAIRKVGSAYVRENYSYVNRLQQMLEVIGLG